VTHNTLPHPTDAFSAGDRPMAESAEFMAASQIHNPSSALTPSASAAPLNDKAYVEISTEKRPARERRILAVVTIPQPIEQVWNVITDYENLADFVPNLTSSKLLPNADGRTYLEQVGTQCFLRFKFCARVVLDMTESFPHQLGFEMKEGDFQQFKGAWILDSIAEGVTQLSYDLSVVPPRAMPAALIEHHICHNLTTNMLAIRQRVLAMV
jgi:ribosome-associated toxin RatA of RatAB toxin-antitoxin module